MKKRILFVDDEKSVLDGLKRSMHTLRASWDMVFVSSGAEALCELEQSPCDVIISDMRMPGMDGSTLLEKVRLLHPDTVRIILSGQADQEAIIRAVWPTQQYLSKPCPPQVLQSVVQRACALRDRLANPALRSVVGKLSVIPTPSQQFAALSSELMKEEPSLDRVAEIASHDIGLTCKVLQIVNSSFFGTATTVTDVKYAICLLGLTRLKPIFLTAGLFSGVKQDPHTASFLEGIMRRSLLVSELAASIMRQEKPDCEKLINQTLLAGLVVDAGKWILANEFSNDYLLHVEQAARDGKLLCRIETENYGANHAELGAYLLGLWGFSDSIVEAAAFHHEPGRCIHREFSPLAAVHIASALFKEVHAQGSLFDSLDCSYLESIETMHRLPYWRGLAATTLQEIRYSA